MAIDLRASVRKEINQLRRDIGRASSHLGSLKDELKKRQRIHDLLGGQKARRRRTKGRGRRRTTVNWNSVLNGLRRTFNIDNIARKSAVKNKPRAYLRQVVVRWAKEGKIKRTGRGKYRKV